MEEASLHLVIISKEISSYNSVKETWQSLIVLSDYLEQLEKNDNAFHKVEA